MWPPLLTHKKCWTHTLQVALHSAFTIPSGFQPNGQIATFKDTRGALTWTEDTGVGPAWTNGTDLPSQMEWPYLLHGHFNLNDIFNS